MVLAEAFLSLLMFRLDRIEGVGAFSFVDDIHIVSGSEEPFRAALAEVDTFAKLFSLQLAAHKSKVWALNHRDAMRIATDLGYVAVESVEAMGAQWILRKAPKDAFAKKRARVEDAKGRLERLKHLIVPAAVKAATVTTACLSLTSYLPLPRVGTYTALKKNIRAALGLKHGAWETTAWCLSQNSLDPEVAWVVANMQLWHQMWMLGGGDVLAAVKKGCLFLRISALKRWCMRAKWVLDPGRLTTPFGTLSLDERWQDVRVTLVSHLRKKAFLALEERRPLVFGGLAEGGVCVRTHKKLIKKLQPYESAILQKIWQGASMTRAHHAVIDKTADPACTCGFPSQSLTHLLWSCPDVPQPDLMQLMWSEKPPFASVGLLCPTTTGADDKIAWEKTCRRAIAILGNVRLVSHEREDDPRGHAICLEQTKAYAYCARCFIARRIRDHKWIKSRECAKAHEHAWLEGEYAREGLHMCRLTMKRWKRFALRPLKECVWCGKKWWATSPGPLACS